MIINLDCLLGMRTCLADNSIDAVVTDPPYGLSKEPDMMEVMKHWMNGDDYVHTGGGFMGKSWDSFVPGPSIWKEVFRVLKPGGHLLAFFGSRTYDLGTLAIRLAGFEIRDQIMWVYGSGFPKSLDVSKAIDKQDASNSKREKQLIFTKFIRDNELSAAFINEMTQTNMGSHYTTSASQPAIATREHFEKLRPFLKSDVPAEIEKMVDERTEESVNMKNRDVIGRSSNGIAGGTGEFTAGNAGTAGYKGEFNITAPATEEAKQWSGWGTALKPAHEPICVARKPLSGTVAENVLKWGTGAINIDGGRVGDEVRSYDLKGGENLNKLARPGANDDDEAKGCGAYGVGAKQVNIGSKTVSGRWPANFVHDGSDEVIKHFPYTKSGAIKAGSSAGVDMRAGNSDNTRKSGRPVQPRDIPSDEGSAARFFYCAKASKADRDDGVSLAATSAAEMVDRDADSAGMNSPRAGAGRTSGARNDHPTVKPTALMQWLVRLVTPPGGTVLDPFTGSGSTGKACMLEGFEFIGFEMDPHYCEIAEQRIAKART